MNTWQQISSQLSDFKACEHKIHGGVSFLLFPLVFPGALYVVAGYVDEALCLLILQGGKINFKSETGDVKGGEKTFPIAQHSIIGT